VNSSSTDTIIAIATGASSAPVGIIRLSGPACLSVLKRHFFSSASADDFPKPRYLYHGQLKSSEGTLLDDCLAVYFKAPHSFTGEDCLEFQCHGSPVNLARIVSTFLTQDSASQLRSAQPGEFSRLAFINGKLDLTQAEALHALISADSEAAARNALGNLDGTLKRLVTGINTELREALALVEASFEFPEEDIQTFNQNHLLIRLNALQTQLASLRDAYATSKLAENGVAVAIVGLPNVGKSSLLNALLIEERAIVSPQAGTTRDVVEGARHIDGVKFIFRDTAGLRTTGDEIEKLGIAKAHEWITRSQIIFFVCDDPQQLKMLAEIPQQAHQEIITILNKSDLLENQNCPSGFHFLTSAKTGLGLHELVSHLQSFLKLHNSVQNRMQITARQHHKICAAFNHLSLAEQALTPLPPTAEVVCEELRATIVSLEEIVGIISNDEVLGEIFSRFCIGK
jgi:tRNA modification GTPase